MTLFVLGAGFQCAQTTKISNSLLHELNPHLDVVALEREVGIVSRCSSLPLSYIQNGGATSVAAMKTEMEESPCELGVRASQQALTSAGVSASQLGLIVCDCGTPHDLIPATSQRIAQKFGIKIPSFDVAATTGPIPAHFEMLQDWQPERIPEYVLLTASNTPSQWIDMHHGEASYLFGDAASALLVSSQHSGKLALVKSALYSENNAAPAVSFSKHEHGVYSRESEALLYRIAERCAREAFAEIVPSRANVKFIGPQWNSFADKMLADSLGILPQNHWSSVARYGNSLGTLPGLTLAEQWDAIATGDLIVCVQVGAAMTYGYTIFKAM